MTATSSTLNSQDLASALAQTTIVDNDLKGFVPSNEFVYFAGFDGTNNDKDNLQKFSFKQSTNVAALYQQVFVASKSSHRLIAAYYPGPGTTDSLPGSAFIPWQVTAELVRIAESAYEDFASKGKDWLEKNPGGSLTTCVTAFSRGAGAAALFTQMVYERGLVDSQTGAVLVPPGQVGSAGALLFDPVLTGAMGNMGWPPNTQNITVIRALDEFRTLFPAADYADPRVRYVDVIGNHGDVGGFYDQGLGALTLEAATACFRAIGLPIDEQIQADTRAWHVASHRACGSAAIRPQKAPKP